MRKHFNTLAIAFVFLCGVTACNNNAPDPTDNINKALTSANIKDVSVDWDRDAHVAHLKGTVNSAAERQQAEQLAANVVGASGKVLNETTVQETKADDMDGQIRSTLNDLVHNDQVLRDRDVNFDVNNGVVTIKGDVRTAAEKAKVGDMVKSSAGVKDMANELEIKPKK